jgi:tetratricopeptide (TPR) repeat protein
MLALRSAGKRDFQDAVSNVRAAAAPPSSLGIDDFATVASSRLLVFEALLRQAAGQEREAQAAWRAAAETRDDDVEGEGLFRAIALGKIGQTEASRTWLKAFVPVNEQRKKDNAADVRIHAWCLAGYYAALEGDYAKAAQQFRQALELDQSYLYARQSLAWLDSGLLKPLH